MDWFLQLGLVQFYQDVADVFQFAVHSDRLLNDYVNNNCIILQQFYYFYDACFLIGENAPKNYSSQLNDLPVKIDILCIFKHAKVAMFFVNDWLP